MRNISPAVRIRWSIIAFIFFGTLLVFWYFVNYGSLASDINRQIWAALYQVVALLGGLLGIFFSYLWGGHKSYIGRGLLFLAMGLLLQCLGQTVYSYFIFYKNIDVPYPSIGDIGFFGSVLMYIGAVAQFAKASGVRLGSSYFKGKIAAFIFPIVMLVISYFFFLQNYTFDWTNPIKVILDFGYPLCEAVYVSIAILTLIFCRQLLGGVMKKPLTFLFIAFVFQYISDFTFLYQSSSGTWHAGGLNDLLYATSYLLMTLGVIYTGRIFLKINEGTHI